jgi:Tfp pilus assembly protein PilN
VVNAVTRFDYLPHRGHSGVAIRRLGLVIDNRIRGPLAALIATLILVALLAGASIVRLHSAQDAYIAASGRLANDASALAQVREIRADALDGTRLIEHAAQLRATNVRSADELVWIGNRLPAHVWLRSLRKENDGYVLEGTALHVSDVGAAILALHDRTHPTVPQLVSLRNDPGASPARVNYRLRVPTLP